MSKWSYKSNYMSYVFSSIHLHKRVSCSTKLVLTHGIQ